jgi:hypothetical protein
MTMTQTTPLLDGEPVLWSARPGLWRSLTLTNIATCAFAIGGISLATYLYLDHARLVAAYGDTAFSDTPIMRNRNFGLMIGSFVGGLLALLSTIGTIWRVTGTQYSLTASRLILASRSLTGAYTVAAPLWAIGPTALGKSVFGYHVVLPAGNIVGTVEMVGLTQAEAGAVLAQYEVHRQGLPTQPTDDKADA